MIDNRLQPSNEPLTTFSYNATEQNRSLFTLTAEEIEMLEMDILPDSIEEYETHGRWSLYKLEFCKKLLSRIKNYQNGK